jgi:lysozyme
MIHVRRTINHKGLELVKHFEGCELSAYLDEAKVWTIGWGHTGLTHNDGTVFKGRTITQNEADWLLRYDMHQFESRVGTFVKVPVNDDQFSALVSFDFNTGKLNSSTLLAMLNAEDYKGASGQFGRWVNAGGRKLRGLVLRRKSERNLFDGIEPFIVEAAQAIKFRANKIIKNEKND